MRDVHNSNNTDGLLLASRAGSFQYGRNAMQLILNDFELCRRVSLWYHKMNHVEKFRFRRICSGLPFFCKIWEHLCSDVGKGVDDSSQ